MRARSVWLLLPALLLGACASWFPAPVPMRSVEWRQPAAAAPARCLVVFLPGFGDDAEDFERLGFVAEVNQHHLSVDLVAAQATLGYYGRGTFLERLTTDVVAPARARGYQQVWLIGMSMGGMGTVFYARAHAAEVTGVLALAPYLGDRSVTGELRKQGGLRSWRAPARVEVMTEDNYQRELWRWLQAMILGRESGPSIYLGFGKSDRLARDNALLATALPDSHRFVIEGDHDWKTWKLLLRQFLASSEFARSCR